MGISDTPWVSVQAKLAGVWTDIALDFDDDDGGGRISGDAAVTITRGKAATAQRAAPMQCDFTIFNRDGKYLSRNPRSPLWGQLTQNTECRVVALPEQTYLSFPLRNATNKNAYAPDSATLDITTDMELRIDLEMINQDIHNFTIMSKYLTTGNNRSWVLLLVDNKPVFGWSNLGTIAAFRSATATAELPVGRQCIRVQFDGNNGAGGVTVTFSTAATIAGPFTQLGAAVTSAGTSSLFVGTADVEIGSANNGSLGIVFTHEDASYLLEAKVYGVQLYSNLTGTLAAEADFTGLDFDDTTYSDGTTTWQWASNIEVASDRIRFSGQLPKWPAEWDRTGTDIRSPVTAYGLFQRLNEAVSDLDSPMSRYYQSITTLAGYWRGEDASDSTQLASQLATARAAAATGITYAAESTLPGSNALFTLSETSQVFGAFGPHTATGEHAFTFAFFADDSPSIDVPVISYSTDQWTLQFTLGTGGYIFTFTSRDGTVLDTSTTGYGAGAEPGNWLVIVCECEQSGGNVNYAINWRTQNPSLGYAISGSWAGLVGKLVSWKCAPIPASSGLSTLALGHIAGNLSIDDFLEDVHLTSFRGHTGETALERLIRLCAEEGIYLRINSTPTDRSAIMGPQLIDTLLNNFNDCAETDRGVLAEIRYRLGIEYTTRAALENRQRMEVSYTDSILSDTPVTDENPNVFNDVIAQRNNGSYSRSVTTTGNKSVDVIGPYPFSKQFNVFSDAQTQDLAGFIRHIGSWDEDKYENVAFQMERDQILNDPALFAALVGLDICSVLSLTDLPDWLPTRPAEIMIDAYAERLTRFQWGIISATSPARVYNTASWNDKQRTLIGSNSSVLDAGINDSVTSFDVACDEVYGKWAFTSAFDIEIDGRETATVTNITGTTTPFTFTVTRGSPSFAHAAGVSVMLYDQRYLSQ